MFTVENLESEDMSKKGEKEGRKNHLESFYPEITIVSDLMSLLRGLNCPILHIWPPSQHVTQVWHAEGARSLGSFSAGSTACLPTGTHFFSLQVESSGYNGVAAAAATLFPTLLSLKVLPHLLSASRSLGPPGKGWWRHLPARSQVRL